MAEDAVRMDGNFAGEASIDGGLAVGERGRVVAAVRARNLLL
ncbi:hypothetical protein MCACP_28150 [Neomoorella carbonis]